DRKGQARRGQRWPPFPCARITRTDHRRSGSSSIVRKVWPAPRLRLSRWDERHRGPDQFGTRLDEQFEDVTRLGWVWLPPSGCDLRTWPDLARCRGNALFEGESWRTQRSNSTTLRDE